jgi:hypothetical protein
MRIIFLLVFPPIVLFAQSNPVGPARFDNTWLNGYSSWSTDTLFGGTNMTFNTYPPKILREHKDMNMRTTNSSFSDQLGNLLTYTNGYYIANRINDTMINGDSINPDYSIHQDRLYQGAVFLPQPSNDSILYLFHEERTFSITPTNISQVFKCYYSVINLYQNNYLGAVVQKNVLLLKDTLCYGKLTATKHANGRDWWLILPAYNKPTYFKYLLTPNGIDTFPPQWFVKKSVFSI